MDNLQEALEKPSEIPEKRMTIIKRSYSEEGRKTLLDHVLKVSLAITNINYI